MNNLKKIRKEKGISITELANSIGMSQSNLTKIENNQLKPKEDVVIKIAQILNVSKDVLFQTENKVSNCYLLPIINSAELGLQDLSQYSIPAYIFKQNSINTAVYITQDDTPQNVCECLKKALTFIGNSTGRQRLIDIGLTTRSIASDIINIYTDICRTK
jgi:transcriptional regulator with XRE-family HTH domain